MRRIRQRSCFAIRYEPSIHLHCVVLQYYKVMWPIILSSFGLVNQSDALVVDHAIASDTFMNTSLPSPRKFAAAGRLACVLIHLRAVLPIISDVNGHISLVDRREVKVSKLTQMKDYLSVCLVVGREILVLYLQSSAASEHNF